MNAVGRLCEALGALPGVTGGRSRFGSTRNRAWFVRGREFAHLHSPSLLDLRLPRRLQSTLRADPRARFRAGASEWLELEFRSPADVARIAALAAMAARASRKRK
jgi:hypothetical protein